jgi:DNA-binding GntR family transcriptional regulator
VLNGEFHRLVLAAAGSPRLTAAMKAASGIPRSFRTIFWGRAELREQSLFCHRQLVAALCAHRPDLAEAVMRMHILGAREFLRDVDEGRADAG